MFLTMNDTCIKLFNEVISLQQHANINGKKIFCPDQNIYSKSIKIEVNSICKLGGNNEGNTDLCSKHYRKVCSNQSREKDKDQQKSMANLNNKNCRLCHVLFRTYHQLLLHYKCTHKFHLHNCLYCSYSFSNYSKYYIHWILKHSKSCNITDQSNELTPFILNSNFVASCGKYKSTDDAKKTVPHLVFSNDDIMKQCFEPIYSNIVSENGNGQGYIGVDSDDINKLVRGMKFVCHRNLKTGHTSALGRISDDNALLISTDLIYPTVRRKQHHPRKVVDYINGDLLSEYRLSKVIPIIVENTYFSNDSVPHLTKNTRRKGNKNACNVENILKFYCYECPEIFISNVLLKDHIIEKHHNVSKYVCEDCGESCSSSIKFKDHCRNHGIMHPFKCLNCEKRYTNENAMKVHFRSHTNHRPYQCPHCDRSFCQSSTLSTHIQRHSGTTPYSCDVCEKAFATKGDLRTHYRIHRTETMFSCDICGKTFPRKSNLTRHVRKHTGEKPYACQFCPKRFARSENRIEHQRTHTKERPYVCEECGASFSDSGNFCNHKKIHSNIKPRKRTNKKPSRTNESALSTVAITNFISNLCTSSHSQEIISGAFQSSESKVVKSSIEPLRINLVRQPSQHHSSEKLKSSTSNESALQVAYLATSSDIEQVEKLTGNEDKTAACNFVTVSGEQLVGKSVRTINNFSVGNQEQIFVGTDLIASIPDFSLSSVHSPSGQAYLMLDAVSRELNLPFLNDTFLVQNPPLSPYSTSGIINSNTYESLIGDDLSHNQQVSPSSEFCLHATHVNYNCDTSISSSNEISTEGSIDNRNEVRNRNTIGDKYPLDTNTFLNDDYLTNNQCNNI